jgi:putative membrane protein
MWNHMMDGWGGYGAFGMLFMFLFWTLIVIGIIALVRYLGDSGKNTKQEKAPLDILKERYAKGEIDKKEFDDKKKDLI